MVKGLAGILEVADGILLLFLSPHAIQHLARMLTAHELSEDPHDLIARYLLHTTAHLNTGITIVGAIYLLSHGIAKIVLVALVLRDKLWAYPWLILLLLAFVAYQLHRMTTSSKKISQSPRVKRKRLIQASGLPRLNAS